MIAFKSAQPSEQRTTFGEWSSTSEHDTVLLDGYDAIATIQDDSSICVMAMLDLVKFTIYASMSELANDLGIDDNTRITLIESIDITYYKLMK